MCLDLHQGFFAIKGDINQKILICQDPLERGCQLLIVVYDEDGL